MKLENFSTTVPTDLHLLKQLPLSPGSLVSINSQAVEVSLPWHCAGLGVVIASSITGRRIDYLILWGIEPRLNEAGAFNLTSWQDYNFLRTLSTIK